MVSGEGTWGTDIGARVWTVCPTDTPGPSSSYIPQGMSQNEEVLISSVEFRISSTRLLTPLTRLDFTTTASVSDNSQGHLSLGQGAVHGTIVSGIQGWDIFFHAIMLHMSSHKANTVIIGW